ncbi:hypothetical protein KUCAC02_030621, partial [Chaenocephalus aceratus]
AFHIHEMRFDPATSEGLTSNLDPLGHQKDVEEGRRKPPTHSLMDHKEHNIQHLFFGDVL